MSNAASPPQIRPAAAVRAGAVDDGSGCDPIEARTNKGHTFGLQLMREHAEDHGGTVDADPTPGGGARVTIAVPMRRERS